MTTPEFNSTHLIYAIVAFCATHVALVIGFLVKEIWGGSKANFKELKEAFQKNSEITIKNTVAVEILTVQLEGVEKKLDEVGELRRDVDKMGASLRNYKPSDS